MNESAIGSMDDISSPENHLNLQSEIEVPRSGSLTRNTESEKTDPR